MNNFSIRPATAQEFSTAIGWAAHEGWNPGLDDLAVFHRTDPDGFLMGWQDGKPVSSISVVKYNANFGFLGFYIVHPEFRGKGYGMATWNAGMDYLKGCTIGLDGVVEQLQNYEKSGFVLQGRNIRFSGVLSGMDPVFSNVEFRPYFEPDFAIVSRFDATHFPTCRDRFLKQWVSDAQQSRHTMLAILNNEICGAGTIRACHSGYKIGPLNALNVDIARALIANLCIHIPNDANISLDVPEANIEGIKLAENLGLKPVFETARMYNGTAPHLNLAQIFGITSFELG